LNLANRVAVITGAGLYGIIAPPGQAACSAGKFAALLERPAPVGYCNLLKKAIKR
jgi:hypothetical protein